MPRPRLPTVAFALLACWLAAAAGAWCAPPEAGQTAESQKGGVAARTAPQPIYWRQNAFLLPVNVGQPLARPYTIVLFGSTDEGQSWQQLNQLELLPDQLSQQRGFPLSSLEDGQYMFVLRGLEQLPAQAPKPGEIPDQRVVVVVDTQAPQVTLHLEQTSPQECVARWQASDVHLAHDRIRIEYQSEDGTWVPVLSAGPQRASTETRALQRDTGEASGTSQSIPLPAVGPRLVRIVALDLAGNVTALTRTIAADGAVADWPEGATSAAGQARETQVAASPSGSTAANQQQSPARQEPWGGEQPGAYSPSSLQDPAATVFQRPPTGASSATPRAAGHSRSPATSPPWGEDPWGQPPSASASTNSQPTTQPANTAPSTTPPEALLPRAPGGAHSAPATDGSPMPRGELPSSAIGLGGGWPQSGQPGFESTASSRSTQPRSPRDFGWHHLQGRRDEPPAQDQAPPGPSALSSGDPWLAAEGQAPAAASRRTVRNFHPGVTGNPSPDASLPAIGATATGRPADAFPPFPVAQDRTGSTSAADQALRSPDVGAAQRWATGNAPADRTDLAGGPEAPLDSSPTVSLPPAMDRDRSWAVGKLAFQLEYDLEYVGPEGLARVDLYCTTDGGRSWQRREEDPDRKSPVEVRVEREGVYGFRLHPISRDGFAGSPPKSGDLPDIWVLVDRTPPEAEITSVRLEEAPGANTLVISWTASDLWLANNPVSIQFSLSASGPWSTVVEGSPNHGQYRWKIDSTVPRQVYLQLEVRDQAGNVGRFRLPHPVSTTSAAPMARIKGLLGGESD